MKYLKVDKEITKEELKPIQDKIKSLGYLDKIEFSAIKKGYIYIYRINNEVNNYCISPHRFRRKLKDSEAYGEEITIEKFLKI